jgi:hypothetical protein
MQIKMGASEGFAQLTLPLVDEIKTNSRYAEVGLVKWFFM